MRATTILCLAGLAILGGCTAAHPTNPAAAPANPAAAPVETGASDDLALARQAILKDLGNDPSLWRSGTWGTGQTEVVCVLPSGAVIAQAVVDPKTHEVHVSRPTAENLKNALERARKATGERWGEPYSVEFTGRSYRLHYRTDEGEMKLLGPRELDVPLGGGEPRALPRR
jgi:hypothetical protein